MSYQVLARKWRPRRFQDLVGQEPVLRVLMNALDKNRLHQAYLFAGTRGVGKTTLARIFAKALNCEVALSSTPCDNCNACRAINAGQFLDLYEIDAASRTKVEDTRDLLENVAYPPVQGRYKVYLIDEVHMLSGHSFNALLKTLEKPPPQVMFLFATTEPKKLPITVLSRCLQFHLRPIIPEQIAAQLQHICDSEGVTYETAALAKLAQAAEGSLRDALSLLDQALMFSPDKLTAEEVNNMLGYLTQDEVFQLLAALAAHDGSALWSVVKALHGRAPDYQQVLAELISALHEAAIKQVLPEHPVNEKIQTIATQFTAEELQLYYQILLMGRKDLGHTPSPAQGFEMLMLRLLAFRPKVGEATVPTSASSAPPLRKAAALPPVTRAAIPPPSSGLSAAAPAAVVSAPAKAAAVPPSANPEWREILAALQLTGLAQALALNCSLGKVTETTAELLMASSYKPMANQKLMDRIEEALSRYWGRKIKLSLEFSAEVTATPAKQQADEAEARRVSALEALEQNSGLQKIKALFGATLDTQSIEPVTS